MPKISHPSPATLKRLGAIYSWLIRQPADFVLGVKSVADAEKLYDGYQDMSDDYQPQIAINLIGYDPKSNI